MVTDPDYKVTNLYGVRWNAPEETAYPSTFVLDKSRTVLFQRIIRCTVMSTTCSDLQSTVEPHRQPLVIRPNTVVATCEKSTSDPTRGGRSQILAHATQRHPLYFCVALSPIRISKNALKSFASVTSGECVHDYDSLDALMFGIHVLIDPVA